MTNEEAQIIIGNIPIKPEVLDNCYSIADYQEAKTMAIQALDQESCEDTISRQAVEDAIANTIVNGESLGYAVAYDILSDLPSTTPQPKIGRWIKTIGENGVTSALRCSKCGFEDNRYMLFRYCPNCGAKMKEDKE